MAGQNWRKNKKGFMVNPDGKTRRQVLAEKKRTTKKAKPENKIVAFDRPTEEKRRKKREKQAIEMERTLLENQAVRDKAKNEKVAMNLQELGLRQNSRKALNKYSLDGTPFEANQIKRRKHQDKSSNNSEEMLSDREVDYIAKSSNLSSQQVREFYAQGKLGNEKTIARFKRDANLSDKLKNIKPTRKFSESEQSLIDKTIKEVKEGKTSKKQIEQARDKQISEFLRVTGDRSIKHKSDKKRRYQAYREIQGLNYVLNQV